jgi:hypothetical protein
MLRKGIYTGGIKWPRRRRRFASRVRQNERIKSPSSFPDVVDFRTAFSFEARAVTVVGSEVLQEMDAAPVELVIKLEGHLHGRRFNVQTATLDYTSTTAYLCI